MSEEPPSAKPPAADDTPETLRARAQRARRLTHRLAAGDETAKRLRRIAEALEAQADALERQEPPVAQPQRPPRG
jgi:hypothetical protein